MFVCIICRFPVELDDAIAPSARGGCICLSCYARQTGSTLLMPKGLRNEIIAVLCELS